MRNTTIHRREVVDLSKLFLTYVNKKRYFIHNQSFKTNVYSPAGTTFSSKEARSQRSEERQNPPRSHFLSMKLALRLQKFPRSSRETSKVLPSLVVLSKRGGSNI